MRERHGFVAAMATALLFLVSGLAAGADAEGPPQPELTPPRLSLVEGQASFWRPGAEDWSPARLNTPLWPGDALYTDQRTTLEIQVAPRAFVRLGEQSRLGFVNLEPGLLQLRLTAGEASLDLRALPAGQSIELDTPDAVLTVDQPGYYRAAVLGDATRLTARGGGRATITTADGQSRALTSGEEAVVQGSDAPTVEIYAAQQADAWDRWNDERTEHDVEAMSARYVSPGVYGVGALDHYGSWRDVPDYGAVWVPQDVAPGWAPYSSGSWIRDPLYGWTWIDDAPWGWAPFHYGRWVFVNGVWAWAPGPAIGRPVYAPALVAFFGIDSGVAVRAGIGSSGVGWVPLGWGEPLRPWWGRPGFVGVPSWHGWGGPRVVNGVVVTRGSVVNVNHIVYQNARVSNAVVAVSTSRFGAGPVRGARRPALQAQDLEPVHGAIPVRPGRAGLVTDPGRAVRPPERAPARPVLATRGPRDDGAHRGEPPARGAALRTVVPAARLGAAEGPSRSFPATDGSERPRPAFSRRHDTPERPGTAPAREPERGGGIPGASGSPAAGVPAPRASVPPAMPGRTQVRREREATRESHAAADAGGPGHRAQERPSPELRRDGQPARESRAASPGGTEPPERRTLPQAEMRREQRPVQESRAARAGGTPPTPRADDTRNKESRREGRRSGEDRRADAGKPEREVHGGRERGNPRGRDREGRDADRH